jgi:hypothetical protein
MLVGNITVPVLPVGQTDDEKVVDVVEEPAFSAGIYDGPSIQDHIPLEMLYIQMSLDI